MTTRRRSRRQPLSGAGLLRTVAADSPAGRRRLEALLARGSGILGGEVERQVARLVAGVRRRGDRALLAASQRFDGTTVASVADLRQRVAAEPAAALPPGFAAALDTAIAAVEAYHRPQVVPGYRLLEGGLELEEVRRPLSRVAVYAPGGRACYPSTLVMTVVPARLAGVQQIVVATPPRALASSPALRHTLARLGVEEVWAMGGAHAVAALAYGTATVPRVDKIVGPGNAWVTAAKRLVAGDVAIDGLAGPTEVVIVADASADPAWVAADLLAQAEHDPQAAAILVTTAPELVRRVRRALVEQLAALATRETAAAALARWGTAFVVRDLLAAEQIAEALAPEHLQLVGATVEPLAGRLRHAGAIFVGASTPEVFGDYVAGPSHVLPTTGSARFASGLGVEDFVRRSHVVRADASAAARLAAAAAVLADAEGLPGHAAAARLRQAAGAAVSEPTRPESAVGASTGEVAVLAAQSVPGDAADRRSPAATADPAVFVRPELRALPAYHLDVVAAPHKLDQNEVPFDLPRTVKQEVVRDLLGRDWSRYPDFHSERLRAALGRLHDWPAAGVLVGNGSNELLGLLFEAILPGGGAAGGPANEVLGSLPSFGLYPMFVRRAGGVPRFLGPRPDLGLPIAELMAEVTRDPRRPVLLCSPNNPTGAVASVDQVAALLDRLEAPLLLDHAYGELGEIDYRPLLDRYRHLVLLRTFSKAWSLAGLRVGYLLADPSLVRELIKVKLPYNLNVASALAAEAALAAAPRARRRVAVLAGRRPQLAALLAAAGLETYPSGANFVLARCPPVGADAAAGPLAEEQARQAAARALRRGLAERGILVRDVSAYAGLAGGVRVSVPNGRSLRALRDALETLAPALGFVPAALGAAVGEVEREVAPDEAVPAGGARR
jgi:histidinol dehydrogenase